MSREKGPIGTATLRFDGGVFTSTPHRSKRWYERAPYRARQKGTVVRFEVDTVVGAGDPEQDNTAESHEWRGTVDGDTIEATLEQCQKGLCRTFRIQGHAAPGP